MVFRARQTRVILSVAVLFLFAQTPRAQETPRAPFSAQQAPGTQTALATHVEHLLTALRDSAASVAELAFDDQIAGHSYYADYRIITTPSARPQPALTVVVRLVDAARNGDAWFAGLPEDTEIILVAPRREVAASVEITAALQSSAGNQPVIYVSEGAATSMRISAPWYVTPVWLTRLIAEARVPSVDYAQLNAARLGFGRRDAVLTRALTAGQAAVRLELHPSDSLSSALGALPRRIGAATADSAFVRDSARNYLVIPATEPIVLNEPVLIWGIVATAMVLILVAVARPRRIGRYIRGIRHNAIPFILLYAALLLSLAAGNVLLRAIGTSLLVVTTPLLLAGAKLTLAVVIVGLLYPVLHIRIARASAVYSGASLLLLMLGALISGAVSVTLSTFFVLSFIFGFLFSIARFAWVKALMLLAAVVPPVSLLLALSGTADATMAAALLWPPLWHELVSAILVLPLLLMFFRLESLTPRFPLLTVLITVAVASFALITARIIVDFRAGPTPEVAVREFYPDPAATDARATPPQSGVIELSGRTQGSVAIRSSQGERIVCAEVPCASELTVQSVPVAMDVSVIPALDRNRILWRVTTEIPARSVRVVITTDQPVQLYASDIPSQEPLGSRGTRFALLPGTYPPQSIAHEAVLRTEAPATAITITVMTTFDHASDRPVMVHRSDWIVHASTTIETAEVDVP